MDETEIVYYMDDETMPNIIKLNMAPGKTCLRDFKQALDAKLSNAKLYNFFFETIEDDCGVVKTLIMKDDEPLPCSNNRVVSWVKSHPKADVDDKGGDSNLNPFDTSKQISLLMFIFKTWKINLRF